MVIPLYFKVPVLNGLMHLPRLSLVYHHLFNSYFLAFSLELYFMPPACGHIMQVSPSGPCLCSFLLWGLPHFFQAIQILTKHQVSDLMNPEFLLCFTSFVNITVHFIPDFTLSCFFSEYLYSLSLFCCAILGKLLFQSSYIV